MKRLILFSITVMIVGAVQTVATHASPLAPNLKRFLKDSLKADFSEAAEAEKPTRVKAVRLKGANGTLLVYVSGQAWCGTSGCTLLMLEPRGHSFREIGSVNAWEPIRQLQTSSHGKPDIGLWTQGGGILPGYESRMRFNGKVYSVKGPTASSGHSKVASGTVLIDKAEGELLYK